MEEVAEITGVHFAFLRINFVHAEPVREVKAERASEVAAELGHAETPENSRILWKGRWF